MPTGPGPPQPDGPGGSRARVDPAVARRHHCPVEFDIAYLDCNLCTFRRVTRVEIYHHESGHISGSSLFAWDMVRRPLGYIALLYGFSWINLVGGHVTA